jgi:hypothetical protein
MCLVQLTTSAYIEEGHRLVQLTTTNAHVFSSTNYYYSAYIEEGHRLVQLTTTNAHVFSSTHYYYSAYIEEGHRKFMEVHGENIKMCCNMYMYREREHMYRERGHRNFIEVHWENIEIYSNMYVYTQRGHRLFCTIALVKELFFVFFLHPLLFFAVTWGISGNHSA